MINFDNLIIYLRKSRSDDPNLSVNEVLKRHESDLQEYCIREYGKTIPEERIYREIVSGETISDRPVMMQIMRLLETGIVDGVLVVEPQRLSRGDMQDCGRIINTLRYTNTLVITPFKTYNLMEEYDRKFFEMELTRGNDYLEYNKKILNRGRIRSVKEGNFIGSIAPYGYNKIKIGEGKNSYHTLVIVPDEAEAVRLMFSLYINNQYGFTNIAKYLDAHGYKPRKSNNWSPAAISDMIDNPVYIGKIRWNYFKTQKKMVNGEIRKTRPINRNDDEIILVDGKHEPIIDNETFALASKRRGNSPKIKHNLELNNPFAGILFCGSCGRAMSLKKYKDTRSHTGHISTSLLCNNQRLCHTKSVSYNNFINNITSSLNKSIYDFEVLIKATNNNDNIAKEHYIATIKEEINKLREKDARQKDAYEDGIYTKAEYSSRNAKLQEQLALAENKLEDAKQIKSFLDIYKEQIAKYTSCLEIIYDNNISASKKNELLKSLIEKIVYYNDQPSLPGIGKHVQNEFSLDIFLKM